MLLGYGAQVEFKGGKVNFKISIVIYTVVKVFNINIFLFADEIIHMKKVKLSYYL